MREAIEVDATTAADSETTEGCAPTAVESQDPVEGDAPTTAESEDIIEMQEQEEARVEAVKGSDYADSGDDNGWSQESQSVTITKKQLTENWYNFNAFSL